MQRQTNKPMFKYWNRLKCGVCLNFICWSSFVCFNTASLFSSKYALIRPDSCWAFKTIVIEFGKMIHCSKMFRQNNNCLFVDNINKCNTKYSFQIVDRVNKLLIAIVSQLNKSRSRRRKTRLTFLWIFNFRISGKCIENTNHWNGRESVFALNIQQENASPKAG